MRKRTIVLFVYLIVMCRPDAHNGKAWIPREKHFRANTELATSGIIHVQVPTYGHSLLHALHSFAMFIHYTFITGCADRGAWPWRKPAAMTV
ncbi:MAG TPA: hypothetical protein DEF75_13375 [Comamonas kerstersii]|nr:hypothetical protein [Comamonas kerstersii]